MDKNKVRLSLLAAGAFFVALAVAFLIFGIVYEGGALAKVLLFVAFVVVLALGIELLYLWLLNADTKPNYFLFNPLFNRNEAASKLTFESIDAKMNKYLASFADSEGKIWTEKILETKLGEIEPQYVPAVAYKLLFDLAKFDNEAGWKCFLLASPATVQIIARGIAKNGDTDMANALVQLKSANPINMKHTRDYLVGNRKYLQKKLYKYVVENIEKF